jgi:hypothetical protein
MQQCSGQWRDCLGSLLQAYLSLENYIVLTKLCNKCKESKDVSCFGKCNSNKDGLQAYCKACRKKYAQDNKDKLVNYRKQYYATNTEVIKKQQQDYYINNKERLMDHHRKYVELNKTQRLAYSKSYYESNKEYIAKQQHNYYLQNKEHIKMRARTYQQENIEDYLANSAKRRAMLLNATPSWTNKEAVVGMYKLARLFNKTGLSLHVDHIVPLNSEKVCGLHCEANLQLLPSSNNISKGNRHWPDMWQ